MQRAHGWACPYGLNVGEMNESANCGLCLECIRSCTYDNVTVYKRPFALERGMKFLSDAWLSIAIFTIAIIYSILYLGHWPEIREYINILDKKNWDLFGIYTLTLWSMVLLFMPGLFYLLALSGQALSKTLLKVKEVFQSYTGALLPFSLLLWMALSPCFL